MAKQFIPNPNGVTQRIDLSDQKNQSTSPMGYDGKYRQGDDLAHKSRNPGQQCIGFKCSEKATLHEPGVGWFCTSCYQLYKRNGFSSNKNGRNGNLNR